MKISPETRESWKYRATLRQIINTGRKVTDLEDTLGVADKEALLEAVIWAACMTLAGMLLIGLFLFFPSMAHADQSWTDEEIVNAIYQAEGGAKAKFPYGIRSVSCNDKQSCRNVCKNTVRNNRKRYAVLEKGKFANFIQFLGSRYCPTIGRTLSKAERKLNGNWTRNVEFYLAKNRGAK